MAKPRLPARLPAIRVTVRARGALEAAAKAGGLTLSEYMLEAVLARMARDGYYVPPDPVPSFFPAPRARYRKRKPCKT